MTTRALIRAEVLTFFNTQFSSGFYTFVKKRALFCLQNKTWNFLRLVLPKHPGTSLSLFHL